ncbi:MAG: PBP1A family penicillin-binding protein [Coriobacteriia bacterium]|nr:PBP1A family penicillin-binding protein [Coriobacteriia bacterium]
MALSRLTTILKAAAVTLTGVLVLLLVAGVYLYSVSATLPEIGVDRSALSQARTSVVYAADGSVLARWHGEQDRTYVTLDSIPSTMRNAVVAIEDERFYEHSGVDGEAIARALRVNAEAGAYAQGGSTITQQVVKLLFTDGERTLGRKIREALLAFELETRASKDLVLETYLNLVYFGEGAYGVEAASQRYFGHPASTLTLEESALLAGIIRAPSRYSPCADEDVARQRRDLVLRKMWELGYISAAQRAEAAGVSVTIKDRSDEPVIAPYFVEYVRQTLIEDLGFEAVYGGGLRVYTTLDPHLQSAAEAAALGTLDRPEDPDVALVCIDHETGEVVAMVGGRDFAEDKFNLAVQGRRQPGSAFKTFVLVTALDQGVQPTDRFSAAPYEVAVTDGVWKVQNYENSVTAGELTLSAATNWSVNAVYARLIMQVGPDAVVETAKRMGITSPLEPNPAIALGGLTTGVSPLEMASAYGTIAAAGMHVAPTGVIRVTDDVGETVWEAPRVRERALSEQVAARASLMLHDVIEQGTGRGAGIGTWAAGKTGTTQQWRDAWFVGYAGRLTTAVWVGHAEGQIAMTDVRGIKVTGGSYPASIWKRFMEQAVPLAAGAVADPDAAASRDRGQREVTICMDSFLLATPRCPETVTVLLDEASIPPGVCSLSH